MLTAQEFLLAARRDPLGSCVLAEGYLKGLFPSLELSEVILNPTSPTALNSLTGRCLMDGIRPLFFKFHSEENEQGGELYNIQTLINAGWPMVEPVASSSVAGSQCVLYPLIEAPTLYELCGQMDRAWLAANPSPPGPLSPDMGEEQVSTSTAPAGHLPLIPRGRREVASAPSFPSNEGEVAAKPTEGVESDEQILLSAIAESLKLATSNLLQTLQPSDPTLSQASIHQLFAHRLNGKNPRVGTFYEQSQLYRTLAKKLWVVNAKELPFTLDQMVQSSKRVLASDACTTMDSVIAHGDEHFANQFFIDGKIVYFDPAFAGRMPALLSMVKATVHNTILHPLWYYEPAEIKLLTKEVGVTESAVNLSHNWQMSPFRLAIAQAYKELVWKPLFDKVQPEEEYLRCAIFCCPFLAKNLVGEQYTEQQALFNLGISLERSLWLAEFLRS